MGLISNGANGRTSGGWCRTIVGATLRTAPFPKKKKKNPDKIILSGCYLKERIELADYVLFNMCSPLYRHLGNTTAEFVHV